MKRWARRRRLRIFHRRRGAMLISVVAILFTVAVLTACLLQARAAQLSTATAGTQRLRAEAAALGGAQVALWKLKNDPQALAAVARVVAENDVAFTVPPLFTFKGGLAGANFTAEVWPGADVLRVRAGGICGGAYVERWTQIALRAAAGD